MKKLFFLLLLPALALPATAQHETLIDGHVGFGGFGGPGLRFTSVNGTPALLVGGRGGVIFNLEQGHSLILGGGGYGLTTNVRLDGIVRDQIQLYLQMGYGGVEFEYVNNTHRLIHPSVHLLLGAGGATYREPLTWRSDWSGWSDWADLDYSVFFVAEPGVSLNLNVTTFFRLSTGLSYRFVSGSSLPGTSDPDLSGLAGGLTFRFGGF
jgi:hypothetical protein